MFIDLAVQRHDSINMVVRSSQDRGSRRCADRIGHITVVEFHPLCSEAIYIGRVIDACAVGTNSLGRMVIGKYENYVGALLGHSWSSKIVLGRYGQCSDFKLPQRISVEQFLSYRPLFTEHKGMERFHEKKGCHLV